MKPSLMKMSFCRQHLMKPLLAVRPAYLYFSSLNLIFLVFVLNGFVVNVSMSCSFIVYSKTCKMANLKKTKNCFSRPIIA